jgi:predicted adenylyl cyclase CyaB
MSGKNIEIKARILDVESLMSRIRSFCSTEPINIHQTDTFFHCVNGRLKLREFGDGSGELIYYKRKDSAGPKLSEYIRYQTNDPDGLKKAMIPAYGIYGVVQKERTLIIHNQTRIHIDKVKYLGDFLELEVVLNPNQTIEEGQIIASKIMNKLEIKSKDLIETAYIDLLKS